MAIESAAAAFPSKVSATEAGARLRELFEEHSRMVYGLCRVLLRDPVEAEDAAQEAFLSAQRSLLAGTEPRDPAAWLAAIARNECRARIRERMRAPLSLVDEGGEQPSPAVEQVADQREEVQALCDAMAELPAQQRQAIVLREIYGLSYGEVSAALGVSLAALKSLLFRARADLQDKLQPARADLGALVVPASLRLSLVEAVPGFASTAAASGGGAGVIAGVIAKLAAAPLAAQVATATVTATVVTAGATVAEPALRALEKAEPQLAAHRVYDFGPTVSISTSADPAYAAKPPASEPPTEEPTPLYEPRDDAPVEEPPANDWVEEPPPEEYVGDDYGWYEDVPADDGSYPEDPSAYEEPSAFDDPATYDDPNYNVYEDPAPDGSATSEPASETADAEPPQ